VSPITPDPGDRRAQTDDDSLEGLQEQLAAARESVQSQRSGPQPLPSRRRIATADLLACLEAFVAALRARRLPIPPRIRDELRLRRALSRPEDDG
jgi:hypothetical protein